MRLTRKTGRNGDSGARGLGLDSVRFDTLGLAPDPDEEPDCRYWLGPNLILSENWFPIPPDLPSLQENEIRGLYDVLLGEQRPDTHGRTPRLLHIAVHHETPVPVVLTLIRVVAPGERRYSFVGSITLPLAECSWVVKVQSSEGGTTGVRETLAGARFRRQNPDLSIGEMRSRFDPYDTIGTPTKVTPSPWSVAPRTDFSRAWKSIRKFARRSRFARSGIPPNRRYGIRLNGIRLSAM